MLHLTRRPDTRGFSLVELVVVVIIIGIIAAIAIPRVTRASQNAGETALRADLKILRQAIDLYAAEHGGDWPSLRAAGDGVGPQSSDTFERHMTWYTSPTGEATRAREAGHALGPYLQKLPALPVGKNKGATRVASMNVLTTPGAAGNGFGWEYSHYMGDIRANCVATETGSDSTPYYKW